MKFNPIDLVRNFLGMEIGGVGIYEEENIIETNTEYPLLDSLGWPIIGSTPDGSPIVICMTDEWMGHIGFVHDMYYGTTIEEWNSNEWNIRIVSKNINHFIQICVADDFPIDGCSAGKSNYLLKQIK